MNRGIFLIIPFFLIRFGLLSFFGKRAVSRVAYFAPINKDEIPSYYVYQISTAAIFLYTAFLDFYFDFSALTFLGGFLYILAHIMLAITIVNFSSPDEIGLSVKGIYKFSRNPMYLSYFICMLSWVLLTKSIVLLIIVIIYQISTHSIIISEERWCLEKFGDEYKEYMARVGRYFLV